MRAPHSIASLLIIARSYNSHILSLVHSLRIYNSLILHFVVAIVGRLVKPGQKKREGGESIADHFFR